MSIDVYLEVAAKRTFAGALDWPGWIRSGLDEETALEALAASVGRYKAAVGSAARGLRAPADASAFKVTERVKGDSTTDFGAPHKWPSSDERKLDAAEGKRWRRLLEASWAAFDAAAEAAVGTRLRKGPRGGGRDLGKIVAHVRDAEAAYLGKLGGRWGKAEAAAHRGEEMAAIREAALKVWTARVRGEPAPRVPRSGSLWNPRYFVRRSAWHALDHVWEIEDRSEP